MQRVDNALLLWSIFSSRESKKMKAALVQGGAARRNSIRYPSKQRKWWLWFIHKTGFFCQRALDKGRSPRGNNSAEKSREQIKPKMWVCYMLHSAVQVVWAAAHSTDDAKNFSQRSRFPSAWRLVRLLHLSQCSSFSCMGSPQLLVRYNSALFRLHSLHQAAVRLHQRVKVTTLSCFPGLLQCHSPAHNLSEWVSPGLCSCGAAHNTSVSAAIIGMLKNLYCSIDLC